jgi:hypothetical protein
MAKSIIDDILSRVRSQVKAVKGDSLLTDRVIYTFVLKHCRYLLRREDSKNKLLMMNSIIQVLPVVTLIDVDIVEAKCIGLYSDCKIKKTEDKLPTFLDGYYGPLIRTVSSIDGSEELQPTIPSSYLSLYKSKNFKYNKTKYFWFLDDYLYFPNLDWDAVRVEGIFEEDISAFTCNPNDCIERQLLPFNVPDYLYPELENLVVRDILGLYNVQNDQINDKQNPSR